MRAKSDTAGSDTTTSFLLRLWETEREGWMVWQALLQNARTGERLAFPSLAECLAYLGETFPAGQRSAATEEIAQGGE